MFCKIISDNSSMLRKFQEEWKGYIDTGILQYILNSGKVPQHRDLIYELKCISRYEPANENEWEHLQVLIQNLRDMIDQYALEYAQFMSEQLFLSAVRIWIYRERSMG